MLMVKKETMALNQERNFYFSPCITLGYTLHSGFSIGFKFNAGIIRSIYNQPISYGISVGKTWIRSKKSFDRISYITLSSAASHVNLGFGLGKIKHRWGYGKRNKCTTIGTMYEAGISTLSSVHLGIVVQRFTYANASWAWANKPYHTLYLSTGVSMMNKEKYWNKVSDN